MRAAARRLGFGLLTVLGIAPRGFFIPYRYAGQVLGPGNRPKYRDLEGAFRQAEPEFRELLARADAYRENFAAIGVDAPPQPRWDQDWFPRLDAVAAYVLVRERRPRRIVEVGSGHSTRFLCRASRDGAVNAEITAIDPAPRAAIEGLPVTFVRSVVQNAPSAIFSAIAPGDMLFIDSSHILMPGTDVDCILNQILPALPAGVLVHIHDVFLPDDYPPQWQWRGYNEQLGVATLLQGIGFRLVWSSYYAATGMAQEVAASAAGQLPLKPGAYETSLWLEKV